VKPGAKVELGGVYNVRDLGGYAGIDGRLVRRGMLFRASSLHRLTDVEAWQEFGASTVIDLRYSRERTAFPLPEFIEDATHVSMLPDTWVATDEDRDVTPVEFLAWVQQQMLEVGATTVPSLLRKLSEPDAFPAVFFCMAGKDRTGFVAAVLLAVLGVSDDDIAEDFSLSGDEVIALVEWLRTREDFEHHPMMNQHVDLLRAPRAAMELFLARVESEYGSLAQWVLTLDIPDNVLATLRDRLLEEL